jgi:hypothetical protein
MWKVDHGLIFRYYPSICLEQPTKLQKPSSGYPWFQMRFELGTSEIQIGIFPESTGYINLYSSPNTIRVIKSRRMRWAGDAT